MPAAHPSLGGWDLDGSRRRFRIGDPRLADRVADNNDKYDPTESEGLRIGRNFGVLTDIQTGPDGTLYLVSLSKGAVYQISRAEPVGT